HRNSHLRYEERDRKTHIEGSCEARRPSARGEHDAARPDPAIPRLERKASAVAAEGADRTALPDDRSVILGALTKARRDQEGIGLPPGRAEQAPDHVRRDRGPQRAQCLAL